MGSLQHDVPSMLTWIRTAALQKDMSWYVCHKFANIRAIITPLLAGQSLCFSLLFYFDHVSLANMSIRSIAEGIREHCYGVHRDYLESLCMELPEEMCLEAPETNMTRCGEHEFDCGDGKCIHGLGLCDGKYQCMTGADELMW